MVDELAARSVLDVGCGTGTFACLLAQRGIDVIGVDPAGASLDIARRKPYADGSAGCSAMRRCCHRCRSDLVDDDRQRCPGLPDRRGLVAGSPRDARRAATWRSPRLRDARSGRERGWSGPVSRRTRDRRAGCRTGESWDDVSDVRRLVIFPILLCLLVRWRDDDVGLDAALPQPRGGRGRPAHAGYLHEDCETPLIDRARVRVRRQLVRGAGAHWVTCAILTTCCQFDSMLS